MKSYRSSNGSRNRVQLRLNFRAIFFWYVFRAKKKTNLDEIRMCQKIASPTMDLVQVLVLDILHEVVSNLPLERSEIQVWPQT